MDPSRPRPLTTLGPRESILLDHAVGMEVVCRSGRLWLTQYGDARDIVLGPGQSFLISLPSCLIMGEGGKAVFVLRPQRGRRHTQGWLRRLAGLFDPRWSGAVQRGLDGRIRRGAPEQAGMSRTA